MACTVGALVGAAAGATPTLTGTQALYTSRAVPQVDTINAGTWGPQPPLSNCTGTYDKTVRSSSLVDISATWSKTRIVIDSPGVFTLGHATDICLDVKVPGVKIHLEAGINVEIEAASGTICEQLLLGPSCTPLPNTSFVLKLIADVTAGAVKQFWITVPPPRGATP